MYNDGNLKSDCGQQRGIHLLSTFRFRILLFFPLRNHTSMRALVCRWLNCQMASEMSNWQNVKNIWRRCFQTPSGTCPTNAQNRNKWRKKNERINQHYAVHVARVTCNYLSMNSIRASAMTRGPFKLILISLGTPNVRTLMRNYVPMANIKLINLFIRIGTNFAERAITTCAW